MKPNEKKNILYIDANNLYGNSMSQVLPCDKTEMWQGHSGLYMNKIKEILNTSDNIDIGHFIEVFLKYPDKIKEKTKNSPFRPENTYSSEGLFSKHENGIKPDNDIQKMLICDWRDEKNYLMLYRTLKFYVEYGMVVENFHEMI